MEESDIPAQFREIPADLLRTLMGVGYYACDHGKPTAALKIFRGVAAVRPRSIAPLLGEAMALLVLGRREEACTLLVERALAIEPENQIVLAFIGMIYRLAGMRHQSDTILTSVLRKDSDPDAVRMAQEMLQQTAPTPSAMLLTVEG